MTFSQLKAVSINETQLEQSWHTHSLCAVWVGPTLASAKGPLAACMKLGMKVFKIRERPFAG